MAGLAIDMAAMVNTDTQSLLEELDVNGKLLFTQNTYRAMNNLRDPGNQLGSATDVNNRNSIQAKQIRS